MLYLVYVSQGPRILTAVTRKRKDMAREVAQKLAGKYAAYQNRLLPGSVTGHKAICDLIEAWTDSPRETTIQVGLLTLHLGFTCPPEIKTGVHAQ
jgi:hypothetical protein